MSQWDELAILIGVSRCLNDRFRLFNPVNLVDFRLFKLNRLVFNWAWLKRSHALDFWEYCLELFLILEVEMFKANWWRKLLILSRIRMSHLLSLILGSRIKVVKNDLKFCELNVNVLFFVIWVYYFNYFWVQVS